MKQFHLSGNPFLSICDSHTEMSFEKYISEIDEKQKTGQIMFIDPKCNLPLFSQKNYTIPKLSACKILSGEVYTVKKKPQRKKSGKQIYLDFIENLSQTSMIKFTLKEQANKEELLDTFQKRTYRRLKSYYVDHLLHYYGIDADTNAAYFLIEPLDRFWKPLDVANQLKAPNFVAMIKFMIKLCRCVESLHESGFPHGYLCLEVLLVSHSDVFGENSSMKLAGLEFLEIGKFLHDVDSASKKYQDPKCKDSIFEKLINNLLSIVPFSLDGDIFSLSMILEEIITQNTDLMANLDETMKNCLSLLFEGCKHPNPIFRKTIEEVIETLSKFEDLDHWKPSFS